MKTLVGPACDTGDAMTESEKQKMLAGALYRPDEEILIDSRRALRLVAQYNASDPSHPDVRERILRDLLGNVGKGVVLRPPFHCDLGYNITLGDGVFANFGCVILDIAPVSVGAQTQIGPYVQLLTADHPRDPALRRQGYESGRPINIGANVWIGGGAIILPGVSVGDDAIIGAGSVVTRDVAPGVTVKGSPAR